MKAIIIAAGMGRRLEHHTEERPKCLVEVAGRPMLHHQLEAYRSNGVNEIHIVRGYLADRLQVDGATYHHNADYEHNNILLSLFCAEAAMDGAFLSSYSDIIFTPDVVSKLLQSKHDISLVVDTEWQRSYEGRMDHPVAQAELTEVRGERVVAVGKQVGPEQALGEFIGLALYSSRGAQILRQTFKELQSRYAANPDAPFQAAAHFRKAYLTDLFLELIDQGVDIGCTTIQGDWREIDTVEDLQRVNQVWPAAR